MDKALSLRSCTFVRLDMVNSDVKNFYYDSWWLIWCFLYIIECVSPPMCGSHWWVIHTRIYWWISYFRAVHYVCDTSFQISGNASDIQNLFMSLGLDVLQKPFNGWLPLNVFAEWLYSTCVTGTWVSSWVTSFLFDAIILQFVRW